VGRRQPVRRLPGQPAGARLTARARGLPFRGAYSARKHGVRGLTRSTARDWAARGIRVNQRQPGVIETPMLHVGPPGEGDHIPAGRAGEPREPREIATAVAFLLSGDASYITGAHLAVGGGWLS
jgi:NAD(P)-dependent dehydrogenase (short-subunit alcohol dehydrogenase family)